MEKLSALQMQDSHNSVYLHAIADSFYVDQMTACDRDCRNETTEFSLSSVVLGGLVPSGQVFQFFGHLCFCSLSPASEQLCLCKNVLPAFKFK